MWFHLKNEKARIQNGRRGGAAVQILIVMSKFPKMVSPQDRMEEITQRILRILTGFH